MPLPYHLICILSLSFIHSILAMSDKHFTSMYLPWAPPAGIHMCMLCTCACIDCNCVVCLHVVMGEQCALGLLCMLNAAMKKGPPCPWCAFRNLRNYTSPQRRGMTELGLLESKGIYTCTMLVLMLRPACAHAWTLVVCNPSYEYYNYA